MSATDLAKLEAISDVDIDTGIFKYVLIKVYYGKEDKFKYIVRGYKWGEYHADIYEDTFDKIKPLGFDTECVGGGRIRHEPQEKLVKVYGYSQGYGRADHSIACDMIKKAYPDYSSVTWENEGY